MNANDLERFWSRVYKTSNCWLWTSGKTRKGYGTFSLDGKHVYAHRLSYQTYCGVIAEGMLICHTCDNPSCVNPEHLFQGTSKDNTQDMVSKGRAKGGGLFGTRNGAYTKPETRARGERHGSVTKPESVPRGEDSATSKLTEAEVLEIRSRYDRGERQVYIAKTYRVTQACISSIIKRKTWQHI